MLERRSPSTADADDDVGTGAHSRPAQRARVLSTWATLALTATIAGALYLLFPKQSLMDKVHAERGNDALTAGYIAALLRTDPGNHELRLLLAEKRYAMGQMALALEAMEPALATGDPLLRRRVLLLEYRILQTEGAALAPGSAAWSESQARLRDRLTHYLGEPWTPQQLIEFAAHARALKAPGLAARFNERLASSQLTVLPRWLGDAAEGTLGGGDYNEAARLYFAARARATDIDERRDYFLKGVAALRSGNLLREALAAADAEIGDLRDDEQVLAYLTRLALAAGDPGRAQAYVKRMLHMSDARSAASAAASTARTQLQRAPKQPTGTRPLPELLLGWLCGAALAAEVPATSAPAGVAPATSPNLRPYDEALYTLAFDVFLANGNVADAWRVAEAAVAQRPDDLAWRHKLAQVSEWSGKPQDALRHWLFIARQPAAPAMPGTAGTSGAALTDEAWTAVLRLAPGLQDDEALLAAWLRETHRRTLSVAELQRIAGIYESLGRPAEGIAFLNAQYESRRELAILDTVSQMQERGGRIDDAILTLERLMEAPGARPDTARAVRLATLLFQRANFARAYRVLLALQSSAPGEDSVYWKLLAELAWQLQDDATATAAYGQLQNSGRASADDVERLVQLLRPEQPDAARRLAMLSWQKFRSVSGFMIALELANEQHDYAAMKALMDDIRDEEGAKLAGNAYYYTLRASYYQGIGNRRGAMEEYRRAMSANPEDRDLRLSYLWLLIDAREPGERTELRQRLREWGSETTSTWWDAYAAGHLALGEPRRALPWMARQLDTRRKDYLWLANYAETLEEAGSPGMAARVRRHAWLQARAAEAAGNDARTAEPAARREGMLAYARLALRFAPGDGSLNAMRRLLREDRASVLPDTAPDTRPRGAASAEKEPAPEQRLNNAVNELALAWTLGEEQIDAARQWMWARFARRIESPAWADIGLALAERDRTRLAELLDDALLNPTGRSAGLAESARIDAARELGRIELAQRLGFAAQERSPDSDDIHLRLATDLLATASSVIVRDTVFERGAVQGHEQDTRLQLWATPRLRLAIDIIALHQHSADATQLTGVPGLDRTLGLSALWRHAGAGDSSGNNGGETEVALAGRDGIARFTSIRLAHTRPLGERVTAGFAVGLRERATESVTLDVGGHKDEASATLAWRLSGPEYLSGRLWQARFHTQHDTYLGSGQGLSMEAGYRTRSEYPGINLRLSRVVSHFESSGASDTQSMVLVPGAIAPPPAAFFMPQSFRLWGLNAGFGTDFREQRSRALRPYADIGRSASSTSGSGYNWLLGAGGSVMGPDHLSAYWLRAKGGGIGAAVRESGLRYQFYF